MVLVTLSSDHIPQVSHFAITGLKKCSAQCHQSHFKWFYEDKGLYIIRNVINFMYIYVVKLWHTTQVLQLYMYSLG